VHTLTGFARQRNEPLRALKRSDLVAPDRMRARIAGNAQMLALIVAVFVLGMKRGAAPDHFEKSRTPSSSSTSSEPVDEPMNTFTPAQPGKRTASPSWFTTVAPLRTRS
jgi:hypothetical protein